MKKSYWVVGLLIAVAVVVFMVWKKNKSFTKVAPVAKSVPNPTDLRVVKDAKRAADLADASATNVALDQDTNSLNSAYG